MSAGLNTVIALLYGILVGEVMGITLDRHFGKRRRK
jgi:F0F1-type ATP synthase assembly protein I